MTLIKKQPFNLDGRKEIGKLEWSKEVVITLIGMGTLALFAFGFFFTVLYTLFTGKAGFNFTTGGAVYISVALFIGTLVLHELIHGVFMSIYGGKPSYGAGIAYFILPYFYTTTKTVFLRNQLVVIAIAPLVVISLVTIGLMAAFPSIAHWMFIPFVVNASGAVGDLWLTRNVLRFPKHVLIEDQKSGLIIYGKETDKTMNISATGFGQRFFKAFILCFFAGGFLMCMAPIALDIFGVESFTIGPANSFFTIFEFHSSVEGFGLSLFPMSMLAISVIAGLVYSIIMTGKPGVVMAKKNPKKSDGKYHKKYSEGLSIGIGLVLGAGTCVAIDNIVIEIGIGLMLGIAIYVNSIVKTSPKGFISNFSIGFLVGISALVISSTLTDLISVLTIATIVVVLIWGCIWDDRSSSSPSPTPTQTTTQGDETVNLANVNTIEIMLLESFPVQVNVGASGEHPDSYTKVDEITTRREGNTFVVTISAFRPADAMCAEVITPYEEVIALDAVGLKAGIYTVEVNGIRDTFELQTDN
ncbi:putative zincin peptidase [Candidatus Methanophagaceae archaeon]|nr:putative zincin peptidase [Methanophagales archaeon]